MLLRRNPVLGLYNKEEYVSYLNQLLYSYGVVTYVSFSCCFFILYDAVCSVMLWVLSRNLLACY